MTDHLLRELNEQVALAKKLSVNMPKQIRVTDLIPEGMMFLSPCTEAGKPADAGRTLDDGGPREILMHPADLKRMIDKAWDERVATELRKQGYSEKYIEAARRREYYQADNWKILGMPVVDARVKIRDLGAFRK